VLQFSSVTQSCLTLRPHESQYARPPCPSPTPGVHSNSRPSSRWCHPAISSSVVPFSSCAQSLPASESFSQRGVKSLLMTPKNTLKVVGYHGGSELNPDCRVMWNVQGVWASPFLSGEGITRIGALLHARPTWLPHFTDKVPEAWRPSITCPRTSWPDGVKPRSLLPLLQTSFSEAPHGLSSLTFRRQLRQELSPSEEVPL